MEGLRKGGGYRDGFEKGERGGGRRGARGQRVGNEGCFQSDGTSVF